MTEQEIRSWLHDHTIYFYDLKEINGNWVCDVKGDVDFTYSPLTEDELPFKFGAVQGDFILSCKNLISTKNFPDFITGNLELSNDELLKDTINYKQWMIQHLLRKNS